jgi:RNA polymerase sigma-70 factor (ECF subfamily)
MDVLANDDHQPTRESVEGVRPRLFGIAYRMLGSVADAEDAVQEAFLRWEREQQRGGDITSPEGWLVTVVSRICLDQLRSARVKREAYVGPWLPEPLVTAPGAGPEEQVELAESLSLAFLILLERLTPEERAVFLLHEIFGYQYAEIGPIIGKSEAACRQLGKRARDRIATGRPRYQASPGKGERLATEFLRASLDGDFPALLTLMTEDVELIADGGGRATAAPKPIRGRNAVARFLMGIAHMGPEGWTGVPMPVNGGPGIVARRGDGHPFAVLSLEVMDERITAVRIVLNPDKLHGVPLPGTT